MNIANSNINKENNDDAYKITYLIFSIIFFLGSLTQFDFFRAETFSQIYASESNANLFFIVFWPSSLAILGFLYIFGGRKYYKTPLPISAIVLFIIIFLSSITSILPDTSIRRSISFFMSMIGAYLIVQSAPSPTYIAKSIAISTGLLSIISVFSCIIVPELSIHRMSPDIAGDWKGVFQHKNMAAYSSAIGLLFGFKFAKDNIAYSIFFVFSLVLFIMSRSEFLFAAIPTIVLLSFAIVKFGTFSEKLSRVIFAGILLSITIYMVYFTYMNPRWLDQFGTTLNGRTEIWSSLVLGLNGHELLGRGFGAVHGVGEQSVLWMNGGWMRAFGHGHSGQLDTLVSTGILGIISVNIFILSPIVNSYPRLNYHNFAYFVTFLSVIFLLISRSFLESDLIVAGRTPWIISTVCIFALHKWYSANNHPHYGKLQPGPRISARPR